VLPYNKGGTMGILKRFFKNCLMRMNIFRVECLGFMVPSEVCSARCAQRADLVPVLDLGALHSDDRHDVGIRAAFLWRRSRTHGLMWTRTAACCCSTTASRSRTSTPSSLGCPGRLECCRRQARSTLLHSFTHGPYTALSLCVQSALGGGSFFMQSYCWRTVAGTRSTVTLIMNALSFSLLTVSLFCGYFCAQSGICCSCFWLPLC
jgi:hypothetical protein